MKVAVSSMGRDLNSQVESRFGRCACFIIVETEDMSYETLDNGNVNLSGGAGIQSGSFVASQNVKAVLTGKCGPKAMQTLVAAGIEVFTGYSGTVREAVEKYKKGELTSTTKANAPQKSGVRPVEELTGGGSGPGMGGSNAAGDGSGRGMGMGGGRGMGGSGRGMGMGGGRGMCGSGRGMGMGGGMQSTAFGNTNPLSKKEDLTQLKAQAEALRKQMNDIELKIKNLT